MIGARNLKQLFGEALVIDFRFSYQGPKPSGVLAMWAQLTGLNQQELLNAITEGAQGKPDLSPLNIHGPLGTVETEVGYARTLLIA